MGESGGGMGDVATPPLIPAALQSPSRRYNLPQCLADHPRVQRQKTRGVDT